MPTNYRDMLLNTAHEPLNPPLGILGGTFDPIHFGHLRTALEVQIYAALTAVKLIPCYQPVHKTQAIATPEQRLAMVELAIHSEAVLQVDSCEIKKPEPSYTINTLTDLRRRYPNTPLCLILGVDALLHFTQWHRWLDILTLAHLIVAYRPGYQLPTTGKIKTLMAQQLTQQPLTLHKEYSGRILLCPVTPLAISATQIRAAIAHGKSVRYLLPDNVYDYLRAHGVYGAKALY